MNKKRKRIIREVVADSKPVIDEKAFVQNASSSNAKKVHDFNESLNMEIWIDKHYQDRHMFGSDDGEKREGIEYENIETIILKSIKHLIYYSLKHKKFAFLNHPNQGGRNIRIILREETEDGSFLNIVAEFHFIDLSTVEITIVTAMVIDDFKFSEGQFGIEFEGVYSDLIQYSKNSMIKVDSYDYED
ncbi:hypothetical protein [Mangrovimonas futianensis]|uniref:hypothetical protein n=1 Tax=Mangrovimonas futianensis TaxID=2895523 RepID=UPI001E50ECF0|nr:hypothetical protein [Mangrovimonas futianensis]MCF1420312.1 hypothetical protein [Mangrovimonas futianensis]